MQKNWYAVYTRPNCEKKVSGILSKKGFENYCPIVQKRTQTLLRRKVMEVPLFKSYVFVKATEEEILSISGQVNHILSLLYWMGKPASINDSEIEAIKDFSQNHQDITLEKLHLDSKKIENIPDGIAVSRGGKILMIKNMVSKVHLPSLGFTMVAKTEENGMLSRELAFGPEMELITKS